MIDSHEIVYQSLRFSKRYMSTTFARRSTRESCIRSRWRYVPSTSISFWGLTGSLLCRKTGSASSYGAWSPATRYSSCSAPCAAAQHHVCLNNTSSSVRKRFIRFSGVFGWRKLAMAGAWDGGALLPMEHSNDSSWLWIQRQTFLLRCWQGTSHGFCSFYYGKGGQNFWI